MGRQDVAQVSSRLCNERKKALRLSKALGRSPESWLTMQDKHAKRSVDLEAVEKIEFRAA